MDLSKRLEKRTNEYYMQLQPMTTEVVWEREGKKWELACHKQVVAYIYTEDGERQEKEYIVESHTPCRSLRLYRPWSSCVGDEADEGFNQPSDLDRKRSRLSAINEVL